MKSRFIFVFALLLVPMLSMSQKPLHVGVKLSGGNFLENNALLTEDAYDSFSVTADYFPSSHLALNAGLTLEQDGLMTEYADGIGMKKYYMLGPEAGAKYYFLPSRWIVQPYVGASVMTNVLNLSAQKGKFEYESNDVNCSKAQVAYDVLCPAVSISPRLGVDVRLSPSILLTGEYDFRFGLYGHSRYHTDIIAGTHAGISHDVDEPMSRSSISLGLKVSLPYKTPDLDHVLNLLYFFFPR